jgi:hypothetical protein
MSVTKISSEFTVPIPDEFRARFMAGQQVLVSADAQGRLVLTPIEQIRARLMETFGMWANRADLPGDSIAFMDELRRGKRLEQLGLRADETH